MAPARSKKAKNCLSQTENQKQKPEARQFPKPKAKNRPPRRVFFARRSGRHFSRSRHSRRLFFGYFLFAEKESNNPSTKTIPFEEAKRIKRAERIIRVNSWQFVAKKPHAPKARQGSKMPDKRCHTAGRVGGCMPGEPAQPRKPFARHDVKDPTLQRIQPY
jgi:hypothetical protein